MESRDMAGELGHQRSGQPTGLGELVEERCLIEASHHNDPIDDATLGPEANPTIRGAGQRSDLKIEVRSRAAVQRELGLARYPTRFRGREVKVRKFYRAFELVSAFAGEKDQRHMGFDDIDPLDCRSVGGRPAQKIDDIALIVGHAEWGRRVWLPQRTEQSRPRIVRPSMPQTPISTRRDESFFVTIPARHASPTTTGMPLRRCLIIS